MSKPIAFLVAILLSVSAYAEQPKISATEGAEPEFVENPLFQAYYDQRSVHFESIKTNTFLPSCKKFFSHANTPPKDLTLYSSYSSGTTRIYIAGTGDNIQIIVLRNGECDSNNFPIFSINHKINSYTNEAVSPILTDAEVTGVFEDYLARNARAFGGKVNFLRWLDEETNRITISCKGQSESICPITYHALQPKLQQLLNDYRKN